MTDVLTMRPLGRDRWPDAMTLAARSFQNEPFIAELFGVEPVQRFALAHQYYRSSPWYDEDLHLGAYVGEVLVGLCLSSPSGQCHVCEHTDPARPPDGPTSVDWPFKVRVRAAHADQGTHAWLSRLTVDPALQGAGIGRSLIAHTLEELRADGAQAVLLECQPHRVDLYVACGFHRVRTFPDVGGPDCVLMRIDLEAPWVSD
jgi:ribosomal protein S18 acetylase RimI-like enzyme